jgi:basic amino acid/polyamine antiporter, APA family
MLGTGVFFTPGEVASVAESPWQVYLLWGLCGAITLCGALTAAELTTLLPHAGASYHIIREGFGPFPAFVKIWIEMWVSGPGSVAGVAIVLGEFAARLPMAPAGVSAAAWGGLAIAAFSAVNLCGVRWGGRTQILLTIVKIVGILALIVGSLALAAPAAPPRAAATGAGQGTSLLGLLGVVGLGVAAVLFTYDGWVDVTHVAGEVKQPDTHLPLALGLGVGGLTLLYLLVNYAYLRVVPLEAMRATATTAVATTVAVAAFGPTGGEVLNVLIIVSILGALGGLILTLPRLYYAAAEQYRDATAPRRVSYFFRALAWVPARSAVPAGSVLFTAALSFAALCFFGTFRRIVTYFVVPVHAVNILLVASVFRLRRRLGHPAAYRAPGYPLVPAVYVLVLALFLVAAIAYNPRDTLIGMAMTAAALPFYLWIRGEGRP